MEPLHFNAKTMTEKRARIAAQEDVISKARAILGKAEDAKMSDQIVDRIFGLMDGVIAYQKKRRYVRVMLNIEWEVTPDFIESIVQKIQKAGFEECYSTTMGEVQMCSAPHRHVWSMSPKAHLTVYKDVKLFSDYHTLENAELAKSLTVIVIPNTWIPASTDAISCETDNDSVTSVE